MGTKKESNQVHSVNIEHWTSYICYKSNANKSADYKERERKSEDVLYLRPSGRISGNILLHDTYAFIVADVNSVHFVVINYYARHVDKGLS